MAINYTAYQAITILREGKDMGAIADIMKRFPRFAYTVLNGCDSMADLFKFAPEKTTARKVNN